MSTPRRYAVNGQLNGAAMTSSIKSLVDVVATAAVRPAVFDFTVGTIGTPADNACVWQVQRFTASGTRTAATPGPLDSGDPAGTAVCGNAHSVEPTYTANTVLWSAGINQRATYRWVAAPGSELLIPATANNGIGIGAKSAAYTGDALASMMYNE